ncbi:MAG TPA: ATP-binding protein [Deinococcales bacterium]|nr:ATP-binding protein [Deinococcales bacterium]
MGTVAAFVLRWLLDPILADEVELLPLMVGVVTSAVIGGFGPGLASTIVCAVAGTFLFVAPRLQLLPTTEADWLRLIIFILVGGTLSALSGTRRTALQQALHSEREAVEERQRLTSVLENMNDAFLSMDRDWRVTYVNRSAEGLLGRVRGSLIGRNIWAEYARAVDSTFHREYHRAVLEGVVVEFEEYYPPLDRWLEVRAVPSESGLAVFFRDISVQRRAAQEREDLLATLEGRVEERTAEVEARSRALEAFATLSRDLALEVEPLTLVGRAQEIALSMLPPGVATYYEPEHGLWRLCSQRGSLRNDTLQQVLDAGLPFETAGNLITPWKSLQPYYQESYDTSTDALAPEAVSHIGASAALPVMVNGAPRGVFGVGLFGNHAWTSVERAVLETTTRSLGVAMERAVATAALAERTAELDVARGQAEFLASLATTLHSVADPIEVMRVTLERLGPALRAQHMVAVRIERDRMRFVASWGEPPPAVTALAEGGSIPLDRAPVAARVARTGRPARGLDYATDPNAAALDLPHTSYLMEPVRQEGGAVGAIITAVRDPTAGEWTPEETSLVERTAETVALAFERAERARRLEERDEEAETFVYTVSHDLRAPILSIQGMSELAQEAIAAGDDEQASHLVERVQRNAAKMSGLLNDLLTFSRAGRTVEPDESLDMGDVALAVVQEIAPQGFSERGDFDLPETWPRVRMPRSEAYQVLANLLGNAVKFAGHGGNRPRVRLRWEAKGERVAVTVEDNGPGIPANQRERVFGLFQRLDLTTEGTGVGLAIVKRIVERHGGTVSIDHSSLGGAAFSLTLPAAEVAER